MGQRMGVWEWSQHHVVSGYRAPGTSTERRQAVQDSHAGLATRVAERLPLVGMPKLLAPQWRNHTLGVQLCRPLEASDVVWFGPKAVFVGRAKSTHTWRRALAVGTVAIRLTGGTTMSWTPANKLAWVSAGQCGYRFRMRHPRRLTRRGSFLGARRLRSSWTTPIAPTASSYGILSLDQNDGVLLYTLRGLQCACHISPSHPLHAHVSSAFLLFPDGYFETTLSTLTSALSLPSCSRSESAGQAHFRTGGREFCYLADPTHSTGYEPKEFDKFTSADGDTTPIND